MPRLGVKYNNYKNLLMTREEILAIESLSKDEISGLVAYIEWAETSTKALKELLDAVFLGSSREDVMELCQGLRDILTAQTQETKEVVPLTFGRIEAQLATALADPSTTLSPDEKVVDEWFRVASTCRMTQYIFKAAQQLLQKKMAAEASSFKPTNIELEKTINMFSRDYSQIRNLYTALVRHDLHGAGSTDPSSEAEMEATMVFDSDLSNVVPFHYPPITPTKH